MNGELNESFASFGKKYQTLHAQNAVLPFKDHPQFVKMVDIFIRKYQHHLILGAKFSDKLYHFFLAALTQYLTNDQVPLNLRQAEIIYIDIEEKLKQKTLEKELHHLRDTLDYTEKLILIVISDFSLLCRDGLSHDESFLKRQLKTLFTHIKCRLLILTTEEVMPTIDRDLQDYFSFLTIHAPSEMDCMNILKHQREELESYHRVLIPEEVLLQSYAFAKRYLSSTQPLEKALLLLDSSAARAGMIERMENHAQFKPVLTSAILTEVLSGWVEIPVAQLFVQRIKLTHFVEEMQQKVFGQEAAVIGIHHELQHLTFPMHHHKPFCTLWFVGPLHSGKETMAIAMVEQLFKQLNCFYTVSLKKSRVSLSQIKFQSYVDEQYLTLTKILADFPYAVLFIEDIEAGNPEQIEELIEILTSGQLCVGQENFNFKQAIIILSSALTVPQISQLTTAVKIKESPAIDLMQLVLREEKHQAEVTPSFISSEELISKLLPELTEIFPHLVNLNLAIIPFLPLNKLTVEKIIRLKLKHLSKMIEKRYGIELNYAPEITQYVAQQFLPKEEGERLDLNKALKQLYFIVEQAVSHQDEQKQRTNQLFLQLNETGQLLRCDWLAMKDIRQHSS